MRLRSMEDMLTAEDLVVRRGGTEVLRGVTCALPTGTTALIGRNGAGKTTLLRALLGLLPAASGTVRLDGEKVLATAASRRAFHARLGWMPQDVEFPRGVTVAEAVEYACWLRGGPRRTLRAHRVAALETADLAELARRPADRLSGGQRRRLGLACALAGDPDVVVLDEPTAGLDPLQREEIMGAVRQASRERTVVVSTHLVEDVLTVADRILVLADGRVVADALLDEIVASGASAEQARAAVTGLIAPRGGACGQTDGAPA